MYMVMGCFIDSISMILITIPVFYPVILGLGIDPIWFGVALVVMLELGQITPPMGINLFVIQGISGGRPLSEVLRGTWPYFIIMLVFVTILTAFPKLALWLPSQMMMR